MFFPQRSTSGECSLLAFQVLLYTLATSLFNLTMLKYIFLILATLIAVCTAQYFGYPGMYPGYGYPGYGYPASATGLGIGFGQAIGPGTATGFGLGLGRAGY